MDSKIILLLIFTVSCFNNNVFAQVAIGKADPVRVTNTSILLEFGNEPKGIILPQVSSAPGAIGGTFVFNAISKVVEVWEGKNNDGVGGWTDLSQMDDVVGVTHSFSNAGQDSSSSAGVIIGADSASKVGALVLESTTKAMVLPKVANPQTTIVGAIAGTMVYDSASDMLSVFDGLNWSYWK